MEGSYYTIPITFDELQFRDGKDNDYAKLGVYTSAQLRSPEPGVALNHNWTLTSPTPIVEIPRITLRTQPDAVTLIVEPPTEITIGVAFSVVCKVTTGSAPLSRQLVTLNMSTSSIGGAVVSAFTFLQNLDAPQNTPPSVAAVTPALYESSTSARSGQDGYARIYGVLKSGVNGATIREYYPSCVYAAMA